MDILQEVQDEYHRLTRELLLGKFEHKVRTIRGHFAVRHYLSPLGQCGVHARVIVIVVTVLLAVDQLEHFPPLFGSFPSQLRLQQNTLNVMNDTALTIIILYLLMTIY